MSHKQRVSSNQTYVTVPGVAKVLGVTPQRVYQLISSKEIPPPDRELDARQNVYTLETAARIWGDRCGDNLFVLPQSSSNSGKR